MSRPRGVRMGAATACLLIPGALVSRAIGVRGLAGALAWTMGAIFVATALMFAVHASFWLVLVLLLATAVVAAPFAARRRGTVSPFAVGMLALGLVAGGAAGNLIDRIRSARGVVDFLDVGVGALRWPTFNVADIAVSCGAVALALSLWREDARRPAAESASAG